MKRQDVVESQLRQCYGRAVYSHKTHEKCADILSARSSRLKLCQIVLSAVAAVGFGAVCFGAMSPLYGAIGTMLSVMLLALNMYTKGRDLGELAHKHQQSATDIWRVREEYLSLITDLRVGHQSLDDILKRRDKLLIELQDVYAGAPRTINRAYRKAQEGLQKRDEMTFSEEEIDQFLPRELRRSEYA